MIRAHRSHWIALTLFLVLASATLADASPDGYAIGSAAYDADQYAEAAAAFARVLGEDGSGVNAERFDRAAYLLAMILLHQPDTDLDAVLDAARGLDPNLGRVAIAMRDGKRERAAEAVAFLRFRETDLPRATRALLDTLERHTGLVDDAYVAAWEREVAHAADLTVDAFGRLWVMVVEPPAFVRFDARGEIVQEIPFVPPDALDATALANAHFSVRPDGGFQIGAHRYAADGRATASSRVSTPEDASVTDDGTVVFLHRDGLRAVAADGSLRWQKLGSGRRSGSFHHPRAMAGSDGAIFVAEFERLQRFSSEGVFEKALGGASPPRLPKGFKASGMNDVSSAGGRVFVGHLNARSVDVYSQDFEPLATFRLPAQRVAASATGMVFGLKEERLHSAIRVPEASRSPSAIAAHRASGSASAPPESPPVSRERWRKELTPVAFVDLEVPPDNVRLHVSTRHVTSLAASPSTPGAVLMGTYGGVLRWRSDGQGPSAWEHWSRMDGFPSDVVHDVFEGPDGTIWAVGGGAVLVRHARSETWSRLERDGFPVNGRAVVGDRQRPGFVWIAAQRGLLHLAAHSEEAAFLAMERSPEEIVDWPDGRLFVRLGVDGVASVDPTTGEIETWVEMEDLRAAPRLRDPTRDRWIMTLSADPEAGVLWLGSDQRELFALDTATRRLRPEWIDGALRPACRQGEIRSARVGARLHVMGFGCHAIYDPSSARLKLAFEHPGRGLDLLASRDGVLLATSEGLLHLTGAGEPARVARPQSEPPDWAPISLASVDGRIWAGFGNKGIGIFDGATWRELEAARSVGRLRVERDGVLALAHYGPGRAFRIDRDGEGLEPVGPGGRSWTYLRDLLHDGEQWWGLGGRDPKRAHGVRRHRDGRDEHWGRDAGLPFGEARRIVPDPSSPDRLWLASDKGLVRLDKSTGQADVVWPGDVRSLTRFDDGTLWAYGGSLLRFDPRTGVGSPFPVSGLPAQDPLDPGGLWLVAGSELLRLDAETGATLSTHPIGLGNLHAKGLAVVPDGRGVRAWIAANGGIVEVRIDGPAAASPAPVSRGQ